MKSVAEAGEMAGVLSNARAGSEVPGRSSKAPPTRSSAPNPSIGLIRSSSFATFSRPTFTPACCGAFPTSSASPD